MIVAENNPCGVGLENGGCETEPHLYLWRRDVEENIQQIVRIFAC